MDRSINIMDKKVFKTTFLDKLAVSPSKATAVQLHNALADTLMELLPKTGQQADRSTFQQDVPAISLWNFS